MNYKKYNFVLFLPANSPGYDYAYADVNYMTNVRVMNIIHTRKNNGIESQFVPIKTPFNPYVFTNPCVFDKKLEGLNEFFEDEFLVKKPIIFMFRVDDYLWFKRAGVNFFQMLRENYPDCKFVCSLNNSVSYYQRETNVFTSEASIKDVHETFDLIITYNKLDAADYGLTHYEGVYSGTEYDSVEIKSDVYFVGMAKDRFEKILKIYESLIEADLKCDFWIVDVPKELQKYSDKIHYNTRLNYEENLKHVRQARGILEIAHGGNYGLTRRFFEALVYDKNYITDNGYINQEKFKKYPKIICVDNWRDFKIDKEKYLATSKLSNNYMGEYSPLHLLSWLESYFNR